MVIIFKIFIRNILRSHKVLVGSAAIVSFKTLLYLVIY